MNSFANKIRLLSKKAAIGLHCSRKSGNVVENSNSAHTFGGGRLLPKFWLKLTHQSSDLSAEICWHRPWHVELLLI